MRIKESKHFHSDDWKRTIYINTPDVKTTDFDISDDKKEALFKKETMVLRTTLSGLRIRRRNRSIEIIFISIQLFDINLFSRTSNLNL